MFRTQVSEEALAAGVATFRAGMPGPGPKVGEFERAFADFLGVKHCVCVSSGTAALHLALHALDLPPGAEIITTPLTFIATHQAILYVGGRPVLADVQPATGNIDPGAIRAKITERTRAILIVHYAGYPCDLAEIRDIAAKHQLELVEDSCHAIGATYRGERIGSADSLSCFSFGPTKNLTTGQGGGITTNDPRRVARLARLRMMSIDHSALERAQAAPQHPRWQYDVRETGFRYHMNDFNAAIGLAQLPLIERDNQRRRELAEAYRAGLAGVPGITLPLYRADRRSSYHFFPVLVEDRDRLFEKLAAAGIGSGVHYPPTTLATQSQAGELPGFEWFSRRELTLPFHIGLRDEDVAAIIELIRSGW